MSPFKYSPPKLMWHEFVNAIEGMRDFTERAAIKQLDLHADATDILRRLLGLRGRCVDSLVTPEQARLADSVFIAAFHDKRATNLWATQFPLRAVARALFCMWFSVASGGDEETAQNILDLHHDVHELADRAMAAKFYHPLPDGRAT